MYDDRVVHFVLRILQTSSGKTWKHACSEAGSRILHWTQEMLVWDRTAETGLAGQGHLDLNDEVHTSWEVVAGTETEHIAE